MAKTANSKIFGEGKLAEGSDILGVPENHLVERRGTKYNDSGQNHTQEILLLTRNQCKNQNFL